MGAALVGAVVAGAACNGGGTSSGSACDHYFDALLGSQCGLSPIAPDQQAHAKARFEQLCEEALAIPNTGVTPSWVDNCASAVQAAGCRTSGLPPACDTPPGSLATGAACESGSQCTSGDCLISGGGPGSDGGATDAGTTCGTCTAGVQCGTMTCSPNQACAPDTADGGLTLTCQSKMYVGAGGACGKSYEQCNPGLYCSQQSMMCTALAGSGGACQGDQECQWPLVCARSPMGGLMGTCQTGAAEGAACGGNNAMPCAPTLYCDPTSLKCSSSITYAQPGQSCAGGGMGLVLCEVGQCMNGKCPTVVADGQPCGMAGTTCDWFANCTQGTCQLPSAGSCH